MPSSPFPRSTPAPYLLIADDEPAVLEVLHAMARSLGWQPLLADTGTQALDLFREHRHAIDCAIVDVHMPLVSGFELLQEFRALQPDARVLLMTGDHIEAESFAGAEVVPDGVLAKPFFMADLEQALAVPGRKAA